MPQETLIEIIDAPISIEKFKSFLNKPFPDMVKFVVDIEKSKVAFAGELHADEEYFLLESGSEQKNLWGGNIYPDVQGIPYIEFSSLINIRPSQDNSSMTVIKKEIRQKMKEILINLIPFQELRDM